MGGTIEPDPCYYRQLAIQPPPGDPGWGGHDAAAGRLWQAFCPDSLMIVSRLGTGANVIGSVSVGDPYFVDDSDTPDAAFAGVDPMVLVSRARGAFELPAPVPSFGPNAGELAVKVPVWFSVPDFAPVVQSATAGRFTATVTAELVGTQWLPGEPEDPQYRPERQVPAVQCDGPGVAFQAGMNPGDPPCGYTYIWQSLKERTDGLGRWVLQVTSNYQVAFEVLNTDTGGVVASGTDTVTTEARVLMPVREWRGMLGDPSGTATVNQQVYPEILPAGGDSTD